MAAVAGGFRAKAAHVKRVLLMFKAVGKAVEVGEDLMDLVTGISGSGPAYLYTFMEALAESGVKGGLTPPAALEMAVQTVFGAARMVQETGKSPADLRDQVASPGGTTLAGLKVMEERGFKDIVQATVDAATARSAELRKMNE
jgi:pyrroline-5-carboxylate reductase